MRFTVRVTPGSKRPAVGGRHGDDLVVRVVERAVDGAATAAVLVALADAFEVPKRAVRLVHGHTSRTKLVEVEIDPALGTTRLGELLG